MTRRVTLIVQGVPQPKGSLKAFRHARSRRIVVTADNPKLRAWQRAVQVTALAARGRGGRAFPGPVTVECLFLLPRPRSYPARVVHHTRKPDLDKLVRAIFDALAADVLFGDDAAVVEVRATKAYAGDGFQPGVLITVADATDLVSAGVTHDREPDALSADRS